MRPANLRREPAEHAEAAAGRHPDDLKSVGYNHALLLVKGRRDALEALTFPRVEQEQEQQEARGRHKMGGGCQTTADTQQKGQPFGYFTHSSLIAACCMLLAHPLEVASKAT